MTVTITTESNGRNGVIKAPLNSLLHEIARDLPGRKRWRERDLVFEMSRANIEYLKKRVPEANWDTPRLKEIDDLLKQEEETRRAHTIEEPPEAEAFPYKTEPRDYQKKAFLMSRDRVAFALFLEQGLGKTKIILDTAAYLWSTGKIDTLLVTAPNGVHAQWINEELPKHMPDWVKLETLIYQSYQTVKWAKHMEEVLAYEDGLKVIAMHHEAFQGKKGLEFAERVLFSNTVLWAIDESTAIKTPGAARTKNVLKLRDSARYRRILSGTPVTRGVEDLFSQLLFLSPDVHGFTSKWTFNSRYCVTAPVPGAPSPFARQIVGYQNLEELKSRLDGWSIRLTAEECLDLPERQYLVRPVDLTPEQVKFYRSMKEEFIAELESGDIATADQAIVRLLRLQQCLCGHVKDAEGKEHRIKSNRAHVALACACEAQGKVIHWARFQTDIDILTDILKERNPVTWDGRTSVEQRIEAKRRFLEDDDCQDFIANPSAAGYGIDGLQRVAHTMIYYSNSFKASDRWQSEARLHRMGQQGTVNVIDLVAPNTVDSYIIETLRKRKDVADDVLDIRDLL